VNKSQIHSQTPTTASKFKIFYRLFKLLNFQKPELIHSWSNIGTLIAFPYLMLNPHVRLISSIRYAGKIKKTLRTEFSKRLSWMRSCVVVSNSKRGLEVENLLNHRKGIIIHNGIDLNLFDIFGKKIPDCYPSLDVFKHKVVMVGRFAKSKDYKTFIGAATIVAQRQSDMCFICIGEGEDLEVIKTRARSLLNKNIFFIGKRNDVPALLTKMDVGVLLNNTKGHAEGISNAIMEYMAAGLPVIATNAGGTPEIVNDNVSGFLVPAFDEEIVADRLEYLISNPAKAKEMGKEGRNIIESEFSIDKMVASYQQLYKRLIQNK